MAFRQPGRAWSCQLHLRSIFLKMNTWKNGDTISWPLHLHSTLFFNLRCTQVKCLCTLQSSECRKKKSSCATGIDTGISLWQSVAVSWLFSLTQNNALCFWHENKLGIFFFFFLTLFAICGWTAGKRPHPAAANNGFPSVLTDINIELALFDRNDVY